MQNRIYPILMLCISIIGILGLLILLAEPVVFRSIVMQNAKLIPSAVLYNQWLQPTFPIMIQFYFFNISNPEAFLNGQIPLLYQLGPYTYREKRMKRVVGINQNESSISYAERKQYFFVPELSIGSESDIITSINLVYLTIAVQSERYPKPLIYLLELAERNFGENILMHRNVSQWLWGYDDPFLSFLKTHSFPINLTRIGLFISKNNTEAGPYVVDSGLLDVTRLGRILAYQGNRSLSCWTTPQANMLNGSDGSLFHPFLKPDESVYIFAPDLCRSIEFRPHEQLAIDGLRVRKYLPREDTFDSPKENINNRGFCPRWPVCYESGVLDMATCQPGPPIAISLPHFVHASPKYQNAVAGLHPSAEFNTTLYLELTTSVVVHASRKIQINANVTRNPKFWQLAKLHTALVPIMFLNETAYLDEDMTWLLRFSTVILPFCIQLIGIVLLSISLPCLFLLLGLYLRAIHNVRQLVTSESQRSLFDQSETVNA